MMLYSLLFNIECKNKKSIFYFSLLIIKFLDKILITHKKSFKNSYKFTLLRSPHVHKSAQHEFKQQLYKKQYLFVFCNSKKLIYLKKLFFFYFQDVKKNCTFLFTTKNYLLSYKFLKLQTLNIILFKNNNSSSLFLMQLKKEKYIKFTKLKNYFKLLNLEGEILINW